MQIYGKIKYKLKIRYIFFSFCGLVAKFWNIIFLPVITTNCKTYQVSSKIEYFIAWQWNKVEILRYPLKSYQKFLSLRIIYPKVYSLDILKYLDSYHISVGLFEKRTSSIFKNYGNLAII